MNATKFTVIIRSTWRNKGQATYLLQLSVRSTPRTQSVKKQPDRLGFPARGRSPYQCSTGTRCRLPGASLLGQENRVPWKCLSAFFSLVRTTICQKHIIATICLSTSERVAGLVVLGARVIVSSVPLPVFEGHYIHCVSFSRLAILQTTRK